MTTGAHQCCRLLATTAFSAVAANPTNFANFETAPVHPSPWGRMDASVTHLMLHLHEELRLLRPQKY